MFDLTLCSIFRDSAGYLDRYVEQVRRVFKLNGGACRAIWLEGDSVDGTYARLEHAAAELRTRGHSATLLKFDTGGPRWASVIDTRRWAQLASCWNRCLAALAPSHVTVCVESDLIYNPPIVGTLAQLLDDAHHAVFPMLLIDGAAALVGEDLFYDTWGFRRGVDRFRPRAPFWPPAGKLKEDDRLLQVTTGGGLIISSSTFQARAPFDPESCVMKFETTDRLFMSKQARIYHPAPALEVLQALVDGRA